MNLHRWHSLQHVAARIERVRHLVVHAAPPARIRRAVGTEAARVGRGQLGEGDVAGAVERAAQPVGTQPAARLELVDLADLAERLPKRRRSRQAVINRNSKYVKSCDRSSTSETVRVA